MPKLAILPGLCLLAILANACFSALCPQMAIGVGSVAASPSQSTGNDSGAVPAADALLGRAIAAMDAQESFSARVHLSGDLFGEPLVGSGVYFEQAPARLRRLRLELNIQLREQPATLLQVCDGQSFWTFRQQGEQRSLSRVDVARVVEAAAGPAGTASGGLPGWPGLGGMPRLLRALADAFQFQAVEPAALQQVTAGNQEVQVPVWRIQGVWRPARLLELAPDQKKNLDQGKPIDIAKLPGQLPTHAVIFVGQTDLIPYRIEYRRVEKKRLWESEPRTSVMLALQLSEVNLNATLDPACFVQHIGDMGSSDGTDDFFRATRMK
jgi:hypothetical protein